MTNLEKRARLWAIRWHGEQIRKYTGEPYWRHPEAVAAIVKSVPHTPEMVAAAYMHDVIEDTLCTESELRDEFGDTVGNLVMWLTDVSKPADGNRLVRKAMDREHTKASPPEAKTVKLADLIDNAKSIGKYDADFARTYFREMRLLVDDALSAGDPTLWKMANEILRGVSC